MYKPVPAEPVEFSTSDVAGKQWGASVVLESSEDTQFVGGTVSRCRGTSRSELAREKALLIDARSRNRLVH